MNIFDIYSEKIKTLVKNLSKQGHYDEASKNFKPSAVADLSDDDRSAYREKFTMKHFDDRVENVLPLIHSIMQEYQPEEPTDADAKMEPIVDHGAIVQGFLNDPAKKLVLRKDDSADKMLSVTKFILSLYSGTISSSTCLNILHGPHQSA